MAYSLSPVSSPVMWGVGRNDLWPHPGLKSLDALLGLLPYPLFLQTAMSEGVCVGFASSVSGCVLHSIISPLEMKGNPPGSVKRFPPECCVWQPVFHFNPPKITTNTKQVQILTKPLPKVKHPEGAALYLHNFELLKELGFKESLPTRVRCCMACEGLLLYPPLVPGVRPEEAVMNNNISGSVWMDPSLHNFSSWDKINSCILSVYM